MPDVTAKKSTIILTAPHALTDEQLKSIRDVVKAQLPADVGLVVLNPGFVVTPVGDTPVVAELRKIGAAIQYAIDDLGATALRVGA